MVTCHIPEQYIKGMEELVNANYYPNRSEVIRVAVRDLLKNELKVLVEKDD
ncbi:MAG: type II toxin-antitoxin system ParD family antitoxin [Candidatus Lokiarchaeota archaeon]